MGIKVHSDIKDIRDYLYREYQKHLQKLITTLTYIGERVVNGIRDGSLSSWNDQTGNLRSSIGYMILVDGSPVKQGGFSQVLNGSKGVQEGMTYIQNLATLYPKGIALIIVAGMDYASYVEAMDNKVVLAQAEIEAENIIRKLIEQLNNDNGK